ncbi:unnamed protein product [Angiostrongylus costaricensis]|uniref:PH domain-containing protein n=1 Tax=Angiostrongylus costaricensis TaxID=334426 RepID=A0A0R3PFF5_ANGCS|nr:unnamed protein product [Angiostrongylus costaricensis]
MFAKLFVLQIIKIFDTVKRLSLGGNETRFTCDCKTPSALQLWLREKRNRDKVVYLYYFLHFCDPISHVMWLLALFAALHSSSMTTESEEKHTDITLIKWSSDVRRVLKSNASALERDKEE